MIDGSRKSPLSNKNSYEQLTYIAESIDELEELNNRNCDGCKFGKFGIDSIGVEIECSLNWDCSRGHKIDKFEKKG